MILLNTFKIKLRSNKGNFRLEDDWVTVRLGDEWTGWLGEKLSETTVESCRLSVNFNHKLTQISTNEIVSFRSVGVLEWLLMLFW